MVAQLPGDAPGVVPGREMAWFRPMGADEVAYHQATVVGRGDDHAGAALAYYGSRGETPLRWAGTGAERLGLRGEVTPEGYEAAFGPGGFRRRSGEAPLVVTRRPGFELVVAAHKSVAMLGVVGHADAMHEILDAETAGTMETLDDWCQARGGRRGRAQDRTPTGGLTYAVTRHATSRAGDPSPHDHVLIANVVEMLDARRGFKALDSASLRDAVEAATMVGRLHAAAHAVALGFDIAPDDGPSGNLRHWRIVGVPEEVCELFSKRSDEIDAHLAATGHHGYRARGIAARQTRAIKRHTGADELLPGWHTELEHAGWPVARLTSHLQAARDGLRTSPPKLSGSELDAIIDDVLDVDGPLLARHKVFTRTQLIAQLAPMRYGHDPRELDRALHRAFAHPSLVPLIGVGNSREHSFTTAEVLAAERTIAQTVDELADRRRAAIAGEIVADAIADKERLLGRRLTPGQRALVERLCGDAPSVTLVIGVAGSGKTTALDAATTALESGGFRVMGTSTSGQAARTLGTEAGITSSTFASLLGRLDRGQVALDARTVVIVDESAMADDTDLARLALAVRRTGASIVLVGDHRQLSSVGPGGALAALIRRRPELVVTLDTNVRQRVADERAALAELRDGSVEAALDWYRESGRVHVAPSRTATLVSMATAWADDVAAGHHTALLAWRHRDVDDLNRLARAQWDAMGQLHGEDVAVWNGRTYAVGDRLVALAPNHVAGIVTSQRLTVIDLDRFSITAATDDGRTVTLTGPGIDRSHLGYGYAVTIHRAQGATFDRAHVLGAGGGRELAYVALSRARDQTTIYATADDLEQALADFRSDWRTERHDRWITPVDAAFGRGSEAIALDRLLPTSRPDVVDGFGL